MFGDSPPDRVRLFRFIPLFLISALAGTIILILTPGYFWDDWVWLHQDPQARIRVGLELGVWWAGYVSNFVLGSANPVLLMRIVAWTGWVITAICFAFVTYRKCILSKLDATFLCCLIVASHVAPVRFLVSVGMYNVYIASFWLGAALYVSSVRHSARRALALIFFFFSFYLNSLILLYGLFFALLFVEYLDFSSAKSNGAGALSFKDVSEVGARLREKISHFRFSSVEGGRPRPTASEVFQGLKTRVASLKFRDGITRLWSSGLSFARQNIFFAVLPVLFIITTKLIGLVFAAISSDGNRIYASYNAIQNQNILKSVSRAIRFSFRYLVDYFSIIFSSTPPKMIVPFLALTLLACFIALWRQPRDAHIPPIIRPILIGVLLIATAVYPYLLVNKAPSVFDFYDARNILPAIPGICLLIIGLVSIIRALIRLLAPNLEGWIHGVIISGLLSLCLATQFILGTDLTKDWIRQMAFGEMVQEHKQEFDAYSTFLLIDNARGYRSGGRNILNYEYTGQLAEIFNDRKHFGIELDEYDSWDAPVPLVIDPVYRKRYNIADYDTSGAQLLIEINMTKEYPEITDIFDILKRYWLGKSVTGEAGKYFSFRINERALEANRELPKLRKIADQLEDYYQRHGSYPSAYFDVPSAIGQSSKRPVVGLSRDRWTYVNRIPSVSPDGTCPVGTTAVTASRLGAPDFQEAAAAEALRGGGVKTDEARPGERSCVIERTCLGRYCEYLYITNGSDYKLVLHRPTDMTYARQAFEKRIDPVRLGYGYWSAGAVGW
ncbi:MAG: hypothetical protein B7Y12_03730 [Rhizobiales bacterium 24-66-13]|nr:MAG: hypothetical protein B7Y61_04170 [Rhizobiales bacterium 35-66-30]OYZ82399.1 MAG: hypothetical protein B7Y12_03730 [Rhizobiales bacterium 24-66-13]OZB08860.1 MAG: hypothetical protein B7X67_07600 [Rhizobiales bacterium 39-66-18]HQS46362.1 hypothetical protein [Xanthobacteraceae bacterium]